GIQTGYNLCNTTAEGQSARCQTAIVNSLDDFCIWGLQQPGLSIVSTGVPLLHDALSLGMVRLYVFSGVQFMRMLDYLQVVGRINQSMINIMAGDIGGGEKNPHSTNNRGNPLSSLVYINGFIAGKEYMQVIGWHKRIFLGGNIFYFRIYDPNSPNAVNYCQHIYSMLNSVSRLSLMASR
ncbi:hypothetical protein M422DRAFT_196914, partial [Sphaerobolus stellatus SS14]